MREKLKKVISKKKISFLTGALLIGIFLIGSSLHVKAEDAPDLYYSTDAGRAIGQEMYMDGHWYLIDKASGSYITGFAFLENAGKWVYYNSAGQMLYGEQCINGHWYLLDQYTGAVTYGFAYIEKYNKWVFYDRVMGWMLYGEQYIDGGWYYLTPGTGAVDYEWAWLPHSNKWVYYDAITGRMYHEWNNINGVMHYFDKYTGEVRSRSNECYNGWKMAQNMSSQTRYLLMIDNDACRTFVFEGSRGNWTPLFDWQCSPGKPSTPTVKGYYTIGNRGFSFGEGEGFSCYYWTQFYGDYLFHSVLYYAGTLNWMEGTMGVAQSHGCVRLELENALWIYNNIPRGTLVYSY